MITNQAAETEALQVAIRNLEEEVAGLRAANAALGSIAERYRAVFTSASYNLTLLDLAPDGSFAHVDSNPMTRQALGVGDTPEAAASFDAETLAGISARLQACRDAGRALEFEEQLVVAGRTLWMQAIYTPVGPGEAGATRVLVTSFDVTERRRLQQQAIAEREAMIQQQSQTLAELSTPLLALGSDVVVLPLVGAVDSRRAQQIMDALLSGVEQTRARTAILDITGVAVVDTQVANALLRAAQAAQLLGARVILTGIRPEIAQTLVGLGVDLSGVVTRSTLQAAIAYSLGEAEGGRREA